MSRFVRLIVLKAELVEVGGVDWSTRGLRVSTAPELAARLICPFDVRVDRIARLMNVEFVDHPYYTALELQVYDDAIHGSGMLAFLGRRDDRRVDYYPQAGLTLDPGMYDIGGGIGEWVETEIDPACFDVTPRGIHVDVRFTDAAGRLIEVRIDDRDGHERRPATLLAPVGSQVDQPSSLMLVYMHGFDLVRTSGSAPEIRVDGHQVAIGRLPAPKLHRRLLIKYASDIAVVRVNTAHVGPMPLAGAELLGRAELNRTKTGIAAVSAESGGHEARLALDPALPDLLAVPRGEVVDGTWQIGIDGSDGIVAGTWTVAVGEEVADLALEVTRGWLPHGLPLLMRIVTSVARVFRTWPTTYRWTAALAMKGEPAMTSRWQRTPRKGDRSYTRLTGRHARWSRRG
jgi:hypothetical protein